MKTASKSGLFLMELIIAILFFSIASAICVQLFISAHIKSKQSVELGLATQQAQTVAETYYAYGADMPKLALQINAKQNKDGSYICYFNDNGVFDSKSFSSYEIRIVEKSVDDIKSIDINIYQKDKADGTPIFAITAKSYTQFVKSEVADNA